MSEPLPRRRLKELSRLTRRRHREASGEFLVEGVRSVESAVDAGAELLEIIVSHDAAADDRVSALLRRASCPIHPIAAREIERITPTQTSQGILAVARIARRDPGVLIAPVVALDGMQDPGNVGAVIRTAAWFGAASVLIGPGTADPFGPKAVRSSMGGIWDVAIAEVDDLVGALTYFSERGYSLVGADMEGSPPGAWDAQPEAVLVLGSEAHGLSPPVRALLDARIRIPGGESAGVESLNAAVAAGILLYHWLGGTSR